MRFPWQSEPPLPDPPADRAQTGEATPAPAKRPLYVRLLRLRHIRPNAWQRAALGEGALALAVVLVLADVASAWTLLVLPLAVALVVKAHDVLAGWLARTPAGRAVDGPATDGHATDVEAAGGQARDGHPDQDGGQGTTTAPAPEGTGAAGRRAS